MKEILIEIPTWLGDAVMTTPAIENIIKIYPDAQLIIFGSFVSTKLFIHHPNVIRIIIDDSKKKGLRYLNLYNFAKEIGKIDIAFSFRRNFTTKLLLSFLSTKEKYIYSRIETVYNRHQVLRYNDFINRSLKVNQEPNKLKIYQNDNRFISKQHKNKPLVGINPGATYGSAKRWYPKEFAKVLIKLSDSYNIKIFGIEKEIDIALDIETELKKANVLNYENRVGKTSVEELMNEISELNLFITNDSGPMHLAAAFNIPTVSIFGPTKDRETHQWKNDNGDIIVRKFLVCAPCMKRVCPLKHHNCMKLITADDVFKRLEEKNIL